MRRPTPGCSARRDGRQRERASSGSATGATASAPAKSPSYLLRARAGGRTAARHPWRALSRPTRWRRSARHGARYRGWIANAERAASFRAPHGDRACAAALLCRGAARHSDDPRVRGAGLRHSAGLARRGRTARRCSPPGTDYLVARNGRGDDEAAPRTRCATRAMRRSLALNGLATIHSRHTCLHRAQELLAIAQRLGANTLETCMTTSPSTVRACCLPTGTARPPIIAGCCATWRGSATTSPSTSPTPTTGRSTATWIRPTGRSVDGLSRRRAEGLAPRDRRRPARADVVVKASGVGMFDDELLAGVLAAARRRRAARSSGTSTRRRRWRRSAPATLHPLRSALPQLDAVLTYGGGAARRRGLSTHWARGAACRSTTRSTRRRHHPVPRGGALRVRPRLSRQPAAGPRGARRGILPRSPRRHAAAAALHCSAAPAGATSAMPPNVRWLGHVSTHHHNAFNRSSARRAQRRARQHGGERLFAGHARVRGRGRGRLPHHRRVGGDRDVSEARRGNVRRARRRRTWRTSRDAHAREGARASALRAQARVLAEHTYASRAQRGRRDAGRNSPARRQRSAA